MKTLKTLLLIFIAFIFCSFNLSNKTKNKPCRYYTYILYGNASLTIDIRKREKVYKEIRIFKSEEGFYACCNLYCSNVCAEFSIKNIGPYESEAICYAELQKQLKALDNNGYKPYEKSRHMTVGVIENQYKPCN